MRLPLGMNLVHIAGAGPAIGGGARMVKENGVVRPVFLFLLAGAQHG
jgi:hypothetical protein